jgi:hypothetical protein
VGVSPESAKMTDQSKRLTALTVLVLAVAPVPYQIRRRYAEWGLAAHAILRAEPAATKLPHPSPAFFRRSADQLSYLNPEPGSLA